MAVPVKLSLVGSQSCRQKLGSGFSLNAREDFHLTDGMSCCIQAQKELGLFEGFYSKLFTSNTSNQRQCMYPLFREAQSSDWWMETKVCVLSRVPPPPFFF